MSEAWRKHLVDEGQGIMRIKAHGTMLTDARMVSDKKHLATHADDRGHEQLVNIMILFMNKGELLRYLREYIVSLRAAKDCPFLL